MRQLAPSMLRYVVLGFILALFAPGTAFADDRQAARVHYQAGVKAYNAGEYKVAIREFSQAQQLAPADLNNYNLALCYDKLGDPEPAIQYYRAYIDKVPGTDKRVEIEASIKRLESAAKSVAAKRAEEERKAEEARRAADAKRAAEEAAAKRVAEEEARRRAEEEARAAAQNRPTEDPAGVGPVGPAVGSTGTPSTGVTPRGDSQIDRVQQIDINAIRDRGGRRGPAPADPRRGPAPDERQPPPVAGAGANASVGVNGGNGDGAEVGNPNPDRNDQVTGTEPAPSDKPKATPVYKKWWFWVVLGVSAYVVYSIAADDSKSSQSRMFENIGPSAPRPAGGMTLMRW